jgi:hypothetical protein
MDLSASAHGERIMVVVLVQYWVIVRMWSVSEETDNGLDDPGRDAAHNQFERFSTSNDYLDYVS